MFCIKCGREGKEDHLFCAGCGHPVGNDLIVSVDVNSVSNAPTKKKFPVWIAVLIICIGLVFVGLFLFIVSIMFSITTFDYDNPIYEHTENYVKYPFDSIPTIYNTIGEYEMCHEPIYEGDHLVYYYCDDSFDEYVIEDYLQYLIDYDSFREYRANSSMKSVISKDSYNGYYYVVEANIYGEYITYYKLLFDAVNDDI